MSDKVLTQQSGFLDMLEHGDTVLADRGFTITDDIALRGAKLVIPSFTRGNSHKRKWKRPSSCLKFGYMWRGS